MVEVTNRTFQKRYLLLPTRKLRRIVRGVLGRVQRKLSMPIHGFTFASNHFHLPDEVPGEWWSLTETSAERSPKRWSGWTTSLGERTTSRGADSPRAT